MDDSLKSRKISKICELQKDSPAKQEQISKHYNAMQAEMPQVLPNQNANFMISNMGQPTNQNSSVVEQSSNLMISSVAHQLIDKLQQANNASHALVLCEEALKYCSDETKKGTAQEISKLTQDKNVLIKSFRT